METTYALIKKHFPETLVLPSIGNNDGWHSQAPPEAQKTKFFEYAFDLWFTDYAPIAPYADSIKQTFLSMGSYRVDVSDTLSVLVLNFEYMDDESNTSLYGNEAA